MSADPKDWPVIFSYTRAQALEDGVLHDVSEMAREAGFKWPVAVTAEVLALVNDIPPSLQGIQSYEGRMWDVLWMASMRARKAKQISEDATILHFFLFMDRDENGHRQHHLKLKMVSGPGDNMEPVITIMREWED